jgi:hypothetical protein
MLLYAMDTHELAYKELNRRISKLGGNEHSEIINMCPQHLLTTNDNGTFCDLTMLDDATLKQISEFVDFSTENNRRLAEYDRDVHATAMLMQRHRSHDIPKSLPLFVKDLPVKNEEMMAQLTKATPKLLFIKRSADKIERVTPMVLMEHESVSVHRPTR